MNEYSSEVVLETASVTDRGLNERRPLNEDALLANTEHRIFAVADGVGGAEAGEVASQTAIEVLDEAFRHHQAGDDVEDLMEIAIQRANASIHQMSRDQSKYSSMATTIVALHLDGHRATVGHVGDSRLYRLTPDGHLQRETDDHSIVEEEVRAGRMTPEQAANHPNRNVISRALGAEASVEVDLKTMEVEDGTVFLLCSDGITRHIPDSELEALLLNEATAEAACAEMKKRCFERGAEDNLTALVIRIGERKLRQAGANGELDDERTLVSEKPALAQAVSTNISSARAAVSSVSKRPLSPPSSAGSPAVAVSSSSEPEGISDMSNSKAAQNHSSSRRSAAQKFIFGLAGLLFLAVASVLAFYVGMLYQKRINPLATRATATPAPSASPAATESPEMAYEKRRREVDRAPSVEARRMESEANGQPLNSNDPEFLYLYGRARMLTGQHEEAIKAFETALAKINEQEGTSIDDSRNSLKIETGIATAAAALKSNNLDAEKVASNALDQVIEKEEAASAPGEEPPVTPAPSPQQ